MKFDFESVTFYVIAAIVAGIMGYMTFPGNMLYIGAGVVMAAAMNYFNFFRGGGNRETTNPEGFFAIFVLVSLFVSGYFIKIDALWIFGAAVMGNIVAGVLRMVAGSVSR